MNPSLMSNMRLACQVLKVFSSRDVIEQPSRPFLPKLSDIKENLNIFPKTECLVIQSKGNLFVTIVFDLTEILIAFHSNGR
jgi:hypothetical protein